MGFMELTSKEEQVKDYMFNVFTPALHHLVSTSNPKEYERWNGNTCRQTAVFGIYFLEELLPEYEWTAWDGDFSDIYMGQNVQYNHAWLHGVDKANRRGLLVDLSRVNKERLFIPVTENKFPRKHPEYKDMKLIRKERIDIGERMSEYEYFTNLQGEEFIKALLEIMVNI
jgi:hypothetical protein